MVKLSFVLWLSTLGSIYGQDYFPAPDSQGGWRTLKDPAQIRKAAGMDLTKLDYAFDYASRSSQHGGLLVVRHGFLVYEKYYGRGNREATPAMASVGKAYTSIACGIMLEEKHDKIPDGLETKVFTEKYLPEAFPLSDPRKAGHQARAVVDHGLGHARRRRQSGLRQFRAVRQARTHPAARTAPGTGPVVRCSTPIWTDPGGGYSYSSQSPHVASIVLRHRHGNGDAGLHR